MQAAELTYNNYMTSAWGPQMCCFHPNALQELHRKGVEVAVREFMENRAESEVDDFKKAMIKASANFFIKNKLLPATPSAWATVYSTRWFP